MKVCWQKRTDMPTGNEKKQVRRQKRMSLPTDIEYESGSVRDFVRIR